MSIFELENRKFSIRKKRKKNMALRRFLRSLKVVGVLLLITIMLITLITYTLITNTYPKYLSQLIIL